MAKSVFGPYAKNGFNRFVASLVPEVGHNVAKDADEQGLSDLQSRFDAFRSASEGMHAQLQADLQSLLGAQLQDLQRHERLVKLGPTEVATRLTQCHADHTAALGAGNWEAAASLA